MPKVPDRPLTPEEESELWRKIRRLEEIINAGLKKLEAYRTWKVRLHDNPEGDRIDALITRGINAIRSNHFETLDKTIKLLEKERWEQWAKEHWTSTSI